MTKQFIKKITNDNGVTFNVILFKEKRKKLVSFYDSRYKDGFTKYGQPVSRYYMNTLLGKDGFGGSIANSGICLHGGVDDWSIGPKQSKILCDWLEKNRKKLDQAA